MLKPLLTLFFIIPFVGSSQTITGILFDAFSTAKNVTINNVSQGIKNYSNESGAFEIQAKINDTLVFESILYIKKEIVLNQSDFEEVFIVDLKRVVNKLDGVFLSTDQKNKVFDEKTHTSDLKKSIKTDKKLNPYKYTKPNPNMDFIAIIGKIVNLFRKKKKESLEKQIKIEQLDSLFRKDLEFNKEFLTTILGIQTEHIQLFFSYCEAKQLDDSLLGVSKRFELMDQMFILSKEYLKFIKE